VSTLTGLISAGGGGATPPTTLFSNINRLDASRDPSLLAAYFGLQTSSVTSSGTYQDIVSVSGSGTLTFLLAGVDGTPSNDLDFKVVIDGTTVLTQEGNTTSQDQCYAVVGSAYWQFVTNASSGQVNYDSREPAAIALGAVPFTSGFSVQVKSAGGSALATQVAYDYYLTS
jgi:hypothetical protein